MRESWIQFGTLVQIVRDSLQPKRRDVVIEPRTKKGKGFRSCEVVSEPGEPLTLLPMGTTDIDEIAEVVDNLNPDDVTIAFFAAHSHLTSTPDLLRIFQKGLRIAKNMRPRIIR